MEDYRQKFQELLKSLFQFECSDLDFGIYRIMNYKRDAIHKFIEKDLPNAISKELDSGVLADQSEAAQQLEELTKQIKENIADDAFDEHGNLKQEHHKTKLGKQYLKLKDKSSGAKPKPALETAIYNHLYSFFTRYYDSGDFLSKRRYSKKEKYAIPYNGEEVYLHWANKDQYYIKTAEYFNDYKFISDGVTIHFKIKKADIEQDNVKGDKRFFIPLCKESSFDKKAKEVLIPVEYRPLTEQEEIRYGGKNQQDKINAETLDAIAKVFKDEDKALAVLFAEKRKTTDDESVSFLEHHLRQYTRRNNSDFFIHKDLKSFLEKELDFYLKNEVLNLDEVGTADEIRAEGWFQLMKIIKAVGHRIIAFVAQIENFQKKLFEKKKFVTETQYCITVKIVPESFYKEISENQSQWDEWKELFHIDENSKDLYTAKDKTQRRIDFLKHTPSLVLDTKHFGRDFTDCLLASFDNLDEMIDGILVNSENFQALNLLEEQYRDQIKSIYIDPPYNTDASSILYKNDYKDSSWLSLVENRLIVAYNFLKKEGIICVAIDDEESVGLKTILSQLFEKEIGVVAVRSNPAGRKTTGRLAPAHEYAMFYGKSSESIPMSLDITEKRLARYPLKDTKGNYSWANFIRSGSGDRREDRPTMYYPIFVNTEDKIRIPEMEWNAKTGAYILLENPKHDEVSVYPIVDEAGRKIEKRWHRSYERVVDELDEYRVRRPSQGEVSIDFKTRIDEDALPTTWWDNNLYASANYGAAELKDLFGEKVFDFAKSRRLVEDCLRTSGLGNAEDFVLDYFAGSGTTAHAVINLNREDGEQRKFILVEMARYLDSVILPRIKKVIFTPEWKDGKPERMATKKEVDRSPRFVKYQQLESYEDALNNIHFEDTKGALLKFDDYLLEYMLDFETKGNETFLNIEKLSSPFDYKLVIHDEGGTKEKLVDLPETFNYLLGLNVDSRKVYRNGDNKYVVYQGTIDHKNISVIWRETKDWKKQEYEQDKKFVIENKLTDGADEIFVNGDSFIPNAKSLDPIFKNRMFAGS